jgi:hypothetical protein
LSLEDRAGSRIDGRILGLVVELREDLIVDLLRSAWVVESARARVYQRWTSVDGRWSSSAGRARRRAQIVEGGLEARGRKPDAQLVEAHADWILSLTGSDPTATPLSDLFVIRLGDWVEAHALEFLPSPRELKDLGEEERAAVSWPEQMPPAPPFEPLPEPPSPAPEEVAFRFGILSDLHVGSARGEAAARAAVSDLNRSDPDLVVQLGDITENGNRGEFELAAGLLAELDAPLLSTMGNHDVYSHESDDLSGPGHYAARFRRYGDGLLREHRGVRFAVLDSAEVAASPFAAFDLIAGAFGQGRGGAVVNGSLSATQHDLLAEIAAPRTPPAFVFLHHPPQPFSSFPPIIFGLSDVDSGRLRATCDSGNVWGVFAGHTHRNARPTSFGSVPVTEVGTPRDFPFGYGLVDVTDRGYFYRFVQLSDQDLVRDGYERSGVIHRRYALGPEHARSFTLTSS